MNATNRRRNNTTLEIENKDGSVVMNDKNIEESICGYFQKNVYIHKAFYA